MAKILIIDDDQMVSATIELLLLKAGHTVTVAANGNLGVASYKASPADLIITDIIMPEKEGIETIQEIRALSPKVPIIAISGGGRTKNYDFLRMANKIGANEVLKKPFANDELLGLVNKCLTTPT